MSFHALLTPIEFISGPEEVTKEEKTDVVALTSQQSEAAEKAEPCYEPANQAAEQNGRQEEEMEVGI